MGADMKRLLITLVITTLLTSCGILEILQDAKTLNDRYCSEVDEKLRQLLIDKIRKVKPNYPDGGECEVKDKLEDKLRGWTLL